MIKIQRIVDTNDCGREIFKLWTRVTPFLGFRTDADGKCCTGIPWIEDVGDGIVAATSLPDNNIFLIYYR